MEGGLKYIFFEEMSRIKMMISIYKHNKNQWMSTQPPLIPSQVSPGRHAKFPLRFSFVFKYCMSNSLERSKNKTKNVSCVCILPATKGTWLDVRKKKMSRIIKRNLSSPIWDVTMHCRFWRQKFQTIARLSLKNLRATINHKRGVGGWGNSQPIKNSNPFCDIFLSHLIVATGCYIKPSAAFMEKNHPS